MVYNFVFDRYMTASIYVKVTKNTSHNKQQQINPIKKETLNAFV